MIVKQITSAALVAALMTFLFYFGSRPYDRRGRLALFFLVVFSSAMAAGFGLQPVGPQFSGVHWLPFFSGGLLSALLTMLLQACNLSFGRQSISAKLEQGARAKQLQRMTSRILRLMFGVVATTWMIGIFIRFVMR